ncbi:hypothetical protein BAOM_3052 [Peribacillus asahii]|uniref:Uncharacterized protein n=1 Tax=Peribacillus asahii TaxID=228899 RepID=A0A3Q9RPY4_9BACI|nr:hypothetical protein [Peribacillus asahii]AZV43661.1 hypothetical protein BAOM_3052 [Peribacillus asahii]
MVEMRFHWWNEDAEKEGTVKVSAPTVEDCIEIAEDEIEGAGLTITDYYVI